MEPIVKDHARSKGGNDRYWPFTDCNLMVKFVVRVFAVGNSSRFRGAIWYDTVSQIKYRQIQLV